MHGIGLTDEVNKKNEVIPIDVMTKFHFDKYKDVKEYTKIVHASN